MSIYIGRTLPPAASPISFPEVVHALFYACHNRKDEHILEDEIKQEFDQQHCLVVSSGKAALVLILKTLQRLYPGRDEVLIPAFTCYSVPAAIKKAGLKIRLCDTEKNSFNFDEAEIKNIIDKDREKKKLLCVVVTHLFGCPANLSSIRELVGDTIPLVEDAAQAMGEESIDGKLGTLGDVGFFSLGRGKNVSTMGGGIIVTNRADMGNELARQAERLPETTLLEMIRVFGKTMFTLPFQLPYLFWLPKILPFLKLGKTIYAEEFPVCRISAFQRGLARNWQARLERHRRARTTNVLFWQENLPQTISCIKKQTNGAGLIRFPFLTGSKKEKTTIWLESEKNGYGIMPAYPTPISGISQIAGIFQNQQFPHAQLLADCLVTLPVHEYLEINDQHKIKSLLYK